MSENNKDIRWKQRFNSFRKALSQLEKFVDKGYGLSELELQGLIKSFEYTYELSWNVIKDYYEYQGDVDIHGSRDAFRLAFKRGLITDGDVWMKMVESRIKTSHTYDEKIANEITEVILNNYFFKFRELRSTMEKLL